MKRGWTRVSMPSDDGCDPEEVRFTIEVLFILSLWWGTRGDHSPHRTTISTTSPTLIARFNIKSNCSPSQLSTLFRPYSVVDVKNKNSGSWVRQSKVPPKTRRSNFSPFFYLALNSRLKNSPSSSQNIDKWSQLSDLFIKSVSELLT